MRTAKRSHGHVVCVLMLLLPCASLAEEAEYRVLSNLRFPGAGGLAGWVKETGSQGKISESGAGLEFVGLEGGGQTANSSNGIRYGPGFSLGNGGKDSVRIEVTVAGQAEGAALYLVLYPVDGHVGDAPAVHVAVSGRSGGRSATVWIGQFSENGLGTVVAPESLPFDPGQGYGLHLTLQGSSGRLAVSHDGVEKTLTVADLVPADYVYKRFTAFLGSPVYGNVTTPGRVEVSRVRVLTTRTDEPTSEDLKGNGPGRDDQVQYIYLHGVANRKFEGVEIDGWTNPGRNDLRYIPRGYQFFRNVPFYISDKVEMVGNLPAKACVILRGQATSDLPLTSEPIKVNAKAAYLYFLHASAWSGNSLGHHCADYLINYVDGSSRTISLVVGKEVAEWWEPKDLDHAFVAWRGKNDVKDDVGFYIYEWRNPDPDKAVSSIVFKSQNTEVTPILIAITASEKKIEVGPAPRIYEPPTFSICEYRQRPQTSLRWTGGTGKATVFRLLPISKVSEVKQARIEVLRYHTNGRATVKCVLGGVAKDAVLGPGELKASFLFTEDAALKYLTENKERFEVAAETDDPEGIGQHTYEGNPNQHWIPGGEDFKHGVFAITGVFQVTGWEPMHRISGYIELRPKPVDAAAAGVTEQLTLAAGKPETDWLGSRVCLNGPWQWQAGGKVDAIPNDGWEEIVVPANVGGKTFEKDRNGVSAWFRKDFYCPAEWQGKRLTVEFESVCDFATVFVNGRKCGEHAGIQAFEVDVTRQVRLGQTNALHLFCENENRGLFPYKVRFNAFKMTPYISKHKGFAYRWGREAPAYYAPGLDIYYKGQPFGRRAAKLDEVVEKGDGLYFCEYDGAYGENVYFSTPGNAELASVAKDLEIEAVEPGVAFHAHHWTFLSGYREPRPRHTGPTQDVFLCVTGQSHISDVFVKPSVRKKRLDVDVELSGVPEGAAEVTACVRDGDKVALDLGSVQVPENSGGAATAKLGKEWADPKLWGPSNPYLYFLQMELRDAHGAVLDRRSVRFGFKEFWIEGAAFKLNGQPFIIQAVNSPFEYVIGQMLYNRQHVRWWYADSNQQVNANLFRWHMEGMAFPEVADVADEMGMLLEMESYFRLFPCAGYADAAPGGGPYTRDEICQMRTDWVVQQVKHLRNHPSIALWSADNECFCLGPKDIELRNQVDKTTDEYAEIMFRLNESIKKADPTRPIDNHGDTQFVHMGKWTDPRLEIINHHYAEPTYFRDWRTKFGKPCVIGEESLGSPFGWCYRGWAQELIDQGKDPAEDYYRKVNAATAFIADKIRYWRHLELPGIYPFAAWAWRHPLIPIWEKVTVRDNEPDIPWPATSGEHPKPKCFGHSGYSFNFWDPSAPRGVPIRTCDALKDNLAETAKLEPRLSPELIVEVRDAAGRAVAGAMVWLIPTNQPGPPIGVVADDAGRAWFWCRSGPGPYTAWVCRDGRWFGTEVTPAPVGEWLQVKTVTLQLP